MTQKKDLKQGHVVPIYTNHQESEGFRGMAALIEKVESLNVEHFIKQEKSNKKTYNGLSIGEQVWYNKQIYFIRNINEYYIIISRKNKTKHIGEDKQKGIVPYYKNDTQIIYNNVYYIVKDDSQFYTDVCTQKDFEEGNCNTVLRIDKPFDCKVEGYEPHYLIWKTERWLVRMLGNPFYGEINVGDSIYYKDQGLFNVVSKGTKINLAHNNAPLMIIKADTNDLFVEHSGSFITYVNISYNLKVGSRHYEKLLGYPSGNNIEQDFDY